MTAEFNFCIIISCLYICCGLHFRSNKKIEAVRIKNWSVVLLMNCTTRNLSLHTKRAIQKLIIHLEWSDVELLSMPSREEVCWRWTIEENTIAVEWLRSTSGFIQDSSCSGNWFAEVDECSWMFEHVEDSTCWVPRMLVEKLKDSRVFMFCEKPHAHWWEPGSVLVVIYIYIWRYVDLLLQSKDKRTRPSVEAQRFST